MFLNMLYLESFELNISKIKKKKALLYNTYQWSVAFSAISLQNPYLFLDIIWENTKMYI